jgi:hypothetical protein
MEESRQVKRQISDALAVVVGLVAVNGKNKDRDREEGRGSDYNEGHGYALDDWAT